MIISYSLEHASVVNEQLAIIRLSPILPTYIFRCANPFSRHVNEHGLKGNIGGTEAG